jgi:site-specific DNA-methyltransferase (cytosine-N4-specific)
MEIANHVFLGDSRKVLKTFPEAVVNTTVTSPPYYNLRDYGTATWVDGDDNCSHLSDRSEYETNYENSKQSSNKGTQNRDIIKYDICPQCGAKREDNQIGLERSLEEYIQQLCLVFDEVYRVTKDDGTFWLNIGDCYARGGQINSDGRRGFSGAKGLGYREKKVDGLTDKDLIGVPWRLAFELQKRGWILRSDIIWAKLNPMPESCTDRPTMSHEYIFLFAKNQRYYYDHESIMERTVGVEYPKRNKRDVWNIKVASYPEAHCATFPMELISPCIKAGSPEGGLVLDPFMGSGTVAQAAKQLSRKYTGCELNPDYYKIINNRLKQQELF